MLEQSTFINKKGGENMYRRKGQSILEYVIVLTAIVAAIVAAASTIIKPAVDGALGNAKSSIVGSTAKLPGIK